MALNLDASAILATTTAKALRRILRAQRRELWECQKKGEDLRQEWLAMVAQDRARALDDPDWERKLNQMRRTARDNAINRKLGALTKGRRGVLDRIQIPTHDWFFSPSKQELYHYDRGVFEAYPSTGHGTFFAHHTLKVLATDVTLVQVALDDTNCWTITDTLPTPQSYWRDITSQEQIEQHLLERNQRHLEQTAREGGISTKPPLTHLRLNNGYNAMSEKITAGLSLTEYELTPEMEAFFSALQRTPTEQALPPILGEITSADVQSMFKHARERTSSDSRTLNYTLWKCMATDDSIAGILSILFSLPFMYGFVNMHWTSMTDFMLEKKPGVRQIHTLRIIGKVAAEFNTCLKFFIGKRAMNNFESSQPNDQQHGFRPNRSSVDAAMLKLLTFECARMQKCTIGSIQHDMTAHFDRMYPAMTSLYATKYGVDKNIMHSINRTISHLRRNVETALGVSTATYFQTDDGPEIGGMVQGKADVPQWSTQQSDAMLTAHSNLTNGLHIVSPALHRSIRHHSISFADDTDGQVSKPPTEPDPIPAVVKDLQTSAQVWSNLVNICGGLIALHKCNWQLIAWELASGHLTMVSTTSE